VHRHRRRERAARASRSPPCEFVRDLSLTLHTRERHSQHSKRPYPRHQLSRIFAGGGCRGGGLFFAFEDAGHIPAIQGSRLKAQGSRVGSVSDPIFKGKELPINAKKPPSPAPPRYAGVPGRGARQSGGARESTARHVGISFSATPPSCDGAELVRPRTTTGPQHTTVAVRPDLGPCTLLGHGRIEYRRTRSIPVHARCIGITNSTCCICSDALDAAHDVEPAEALTCARAHTAPVAKVACPERPQVPTGWCASGRHAAGKKACSLRP
jgi:hypothetical protein